MPREIEKWTPSRSNFWCPFSQTLATWLLVQRSYMSKCNQQPRQSCTFLQLTIICLLFRLKNRRYSRRPLYICMTNSDAALYTLADDLIKGHFRLRTPEPVIMPADEYQWPTCGYCRHVCTSLRKVGQISCGRPIRNLSNNCLILVTFIISTKVQVQKVLLRDQLSARKCLPSK